VLQSGNPISDADYTVIEALLHTHTPCLMSIAIVLVSDLQEPLMYKKGV